LRLAVGALGVLLRSAFGGIGLVESSSEAVENRAPDGDRTVVVVRAVDDDPRGLAGARLTEDALADLAQAVVLLVGLPVVFRHAPGGELVLLELLESLSLRLLREVEP